MSDLIFNTLTQSNGQFVSSDNKEQKTSRLMKGMYDFEKLLLDDISQEDELIKEKRLSEGDADTILLNVIENNKNQNLPSNIIGNMKKSYPINTFTKTIYSESSANKIKLLVGNLIKTEQSVNTEFPTKESRKLTKLSSNNKLIVDKVNQSNKQTDLESIRLVKTDKGYVLYLNIDSSGLSTSNVLEILKIIESDKKVLLNKVVVNRETILDKNITFHSDVEILSESKLNIKI